MAFIAQEVPSLLVAQDMCFIAKPECWSDSVRYEAYL